MNVTFGRTRSYTKSFHVVKGPTSLGVTCRSLISKGNPTKSHKSCGMAIKHLLKSPTCILQSDLNVFNVEKGKAMRGFITLCIFQPNMYSDQNPKTTLTNTWLTHLAVGLV